MSKARHPFDLRPGTPRALELLLRAWFWFGPLHCTQRRRAASAILEDLQ